MKTINKILSFIFSFVIFVIVVCLLFLTLSLECFFALFFLGGICFLALLYIDKKYTGTYKVYKVFRKSQKRQIIERGLTREEAMRVVQSFPNSNTSMVVFDKQFTAEKYFV